MTDIKLRSALPDDSRFLALSVLAAIDVYHFGEPLPEVLPALEQVCKRDDTLYSYRNAVVAVVDGVVVGSLIAYSGDEYEQMRMRTFPSLFPLIGQSDTSSFGRETGPGEFYLDSMAILPQWRGNGIGHSLMQAQIDRGTALGLSKFTFLVDSDRPRLKEYYNRLGFADEGTVSFFGHQYIRGVSTCNKKASAVADALSL